MTALSGARIVLGVTGGIAAYKAVEISRRLVDAGARMRVDRGGVGRAVRRGDLRREGGRVERVRGEVARAGIAARRSRAAPGSW